MGQLLFLEIQSGL